MERGRIENEREDRKEMREVLDKNAGVRSEGNEALNR